MALGEPRRIVFGGLLPLSEYAVQTYVEPGLIIFLAIPFAFVSISLSLWLIYAAITVWVSEMIVMELMINRVLDQFDGEVEARQLQEARRLLKENAKQQRVAKTAGVRAAAFSDDIQAALGMSTNA